VDTDEDMYAISIDRINGHKSYEIGNVRLVCRYTNGALANTGEEMFWFFVGKLAKQLK
jgi:hypothetical protein